MQNLKKCKILNIEEYSEDIEDVYNIEVEDNHNYFANGILTKNCHHIQSITYLTMAKYIQCKYMFGFSGSLYQDAKDILTSQHDTVIQGFFGSPIFRINIKHLYELGLLAKPLIFMQTITGRKGYQVASNYNKLYEKHITENKIRNNKIVSLGSYILKMGLRTLITVQRKQHGIDLLNQFKSDKVACMYGGKQLHTYDEHLNTIDSGKFDLEIFIKNFEKGIYKTVIVSQVGDEGLDLPNVNAYIMAGGGRCLTGDTKLKLLNGKNLTMEELTKNYKNKQFGVYSCNSNGEIVAAQAHSPRITKYVNCLYRITLDNGEIIKCTNTHPFMLRDGNYKKANELKENDSLMPLKTNLNKYGYETITDNLTQKRINTHKLVAKNLKKPKLTINNRFFVVHHIDFNKLNNSFNNLVYMGDYDHWIYHSRLAHEVLKKHNYNREATIKRNQSPKGRETSRQVMINNWNTLGFRELVINAVIRGNKKHKKEITERWNKILFQMNNAPEYEEFRKKRKEWMRELQKNPDVLTKRIKGIKKKWKDEKFREYMKPIQSKNLKSISVEDRRRNTKKQWENNEYRKKMSNIMKNVNKKLWKDEEFIERKKQWGKELFINLNKNPQIKKKQQLSKLMKIINICNNKGLEINETNYEKSRNELKYPGAYPNYNTYLKATNHKVKSIEIINLKEPTPVYDITVDKYHNFALSAGVFVHNSNIKITQRIGRALRRKEHKNTAIIIDFNDLTHFYFKAQSIARRKIYTLLHATITENVIDIKQEIDEIGVLISENE